MDTFATLIGVSVWEWSQCRQDWGRGVDFFHHHLNTWIQPSMKPDLWSFQVIWNNTFSTFKSPGSFKIPVREFPVDRVSLCIFVNVMSYSVLGLDTQIQVAHGIALKTFIVQRLNIPVTISHRQWEQQLTGHKDKHWSGNRLSCHEGVTGFIIFTWGV